MFVVIYHKCFGGLGPDELRVVASFMNEVDAHKCSCELNIDDKVSWDILNVHFIRSGVDTSKMSREEKLALLIADEDSMVADYGLYQRYEAPDPFDPL